MLGSNYMKNAWELCYFRNCCHVYFRWPKINSNCKVRALRLKDVNCYTLYTESVPHIMKSLIFFILNFALRNLSYVRNLSSTCKCKPFSKPFKITRVHRVRSICRWLRTSSNQNSRLTASQPLFPRNRIIIERIISAWKLDLRALGMFHETELISRKHGQLPQCWVTPWLADHYNSRF